MISEQIQRKILPGTVIPKPDSKADFMVKGWGRRRGEPALIYYIPNHNNPNKPYQKGINVSEWEVAYLQLLDTGSFSHEWFVRHIKACNEEGSCNFTTIGGIFELLGLTKYMRGVYQKESDRVNQKIIRIGPSGL